MYNKSLAIIFITLFFTVTFLTNHIFSQSPAGLILGISGEVGSSSQKLTDDYLLVQQFRAEDSKSTLAYGLGVNVGVRLGNFSFITGGSYIRRGGGTDAEILGRNYTPRNPSATSPGPDLEVIVEDRLSLNLLRVPFLLGYQFGSDNFKFRISAGSSVNFYTTGALKSARTADDAIYPVKDQCQDVPKGSLVYFDQNGQFLKFTR